jgi:hypothetical protein
MPPHDGILSCPPKEIPTLRLRSGITPHALDNTQVRLSPGDQGQGGEAMPVHGNCWA